MPTTNTITICNTIKVPQHIPLNLQQLYNNTSNIDIFIFDTIDDIGNIGNIRNLGNDMGNGMSNVGGMNKLNVSCLIPNVFGNDYDQIQQIILFFKTEGYIQNFTNTVTYGGCDINNNGNASDSNINNSNNGGNLNSLNNLGMQTI